MIGLDTNVVARLFVDDDPHPAQRARTLVAERCTAERPGFINLVTLCELVWVLATGHGFGRAAIASLVEDLLQAENLVIQAPDLVSAAVAVSRSKPIGLADAIIVEINRSQGCEATVTFDRRASKVPGLELLAANYGGLD